MAWASPPSPRRPQGELPLPHRQRDMSGSQQIEKAREKARTYRVTGTVIGSGVEVPIEVELVAGSPEEAQQVVAAWYEGGPNRIVGLTVTERPVQRAA